MKNPFMPDEKSDLVIVDGRASEEIIKGLKILDLDIVKTIKCEEVYEAISYHPDIVIHPLNENTLIVAPNVYDYYKDLFKLKKIKVIKGEKWLKRNYPNNVAYNVARVSGYAIHNFKHTDPKLKFYLKKAGIEMINVNQGYSKCSIANVSKNTIITSDPSIFKALNNFNINILNIEKGFIELPGLNYGFIGGSTGYIGNDKVLFTGSLGNHPDQVKILNFLDKLKKEPIFLSRKKIIDLGSIIPLKYI
ncbi:MAG: hypothetical protein FH751_05870 [Firmicutes bacterium]|nr:hypothetical protein [Bacillota bacterium]